eukprot:TRINITY_DN5683_c0_g1_i1.p2 TRINITY_DN5683_c0_g1~~TRINITY_DN5683_c0_g1_i1.p2  ORF type:complete len:156 (+),score=23.45 TRINITY_DN5683_c0_g1_i1:212-679(+)
MRSRSRSGSTGYVYRYCVVVPGVGGEPPKAPIRVKLVGNELLRKIKTRVSEAIPGVGGVEMVLYHGGKPLCEGKSSGEEGIEPETLNVVQVHFPTPPPIPELKTALVHLESLRDKVDKQSQQLTAERELRTLAEGQLNGIPVSAVDTLIAKYRNM